MKVMVNVCQALGCTNTSRNRKGVTFYTLPKDKELLRKWLVNLRVKSLPNWDCHVCAEHFEPECFGRDLRTELLGKGHSKRKSKLPLLKDAVPTLFLHNNFKNAKRRVYSEERNKRKEKEEILKDLLGPTYYNMKPPPLDKQNLGSEDGEEDNKYSIRQLLSGFSGAQDMIENSDHDQSRSGADNDVSSTHEQSRSGTERDVSTGQAQNLTAAAITPNNQTQTANNNKTIIICKISFTKEMSCQTEQSRKIDFTCLAKPCMVSTETQWDEKDFLPNPELVKRDHSYCASAVREEIPVQPLQQTHKRKHSAKSPVQPLQPTHKRKRSAKSPVHRLQLRKRKLSSRRK